MWYVGYGDNVDERYGDKVDERDDDRHGESQWGIKYTLLIEWNHHILHITIVNRIKRFFPLIIHYNGRI